MSLACSDLKRVQGSEKSSVRRDLGKSKCAGFETNTRSFITKVTVTSQQVRYRYQADPLFP